MLAAVLTIRPSRCRARRRLIVRRRVWVSLWRRHMRLASATVVVALALTTAACRTSMGRPSGDKDLAAKLRELGIEGKTYANDLGQVASIRVGNVYAIGPDLLIEDIHGHLTYIDGAT